MTYKPHDLLAFGGHSGHVDEQWACGIRLMMFGDAVGVEPDHEEYLTTVALPALQTWFTSAGASIHNGARLEWIKFNRIGANGRYTNSGATHERTVNYSGGKSGTVNAHPLQVCCVTSFRTNAASRGKGSKGRIFSPRPVVAVDTNGDVAPGERTPIATAMALLLNTLDIGVGGPGGFMWPAIVSRGTAPGYADEGPANQIDFVIVDSALDIQRRRAYSQSREETSVAVTY